MQPLPVRSVPAGVRLPAGVAAPPAVGRQAGAHFSSPNRIQTDMSKIICASLLLFLLTVAPVASQQWTPEQQEVGATADTLKPAASTRTAVVERMSADTGLAEAIVYTSLRPPNWDVYLFEGPGAEPRRLTDDPALDYNAVFAPDGRWVVFTSERGGNADLYALDLEQEEAAPIRLTRHIAMDDAAAFSPDGRRLAFVSTRDGVADVFVMPFTPGDTTADAQAVNLTRGEGGLNPAFSPDGLHIAFSRAIPFTLNFDPGANVIGPFSADLFVMDAQGQNARQLSQPGALSGSPAWSLDGQTIYYHRVDFEGAEIRRVAADASADENLVMLGLSPVVRPDGRIGFFRLQPRSGVPSFVLLRNGHIYSVAADGTDLRLESDTLRSYFAPDFNRRTGHMIAHGRGPDHGMVMVLDGAAAFAPPDAHRRASLSDRTIEVIGMRGGYFPALAPGGEVVSTPGLYATLPLSVSAVDGSGSRALFKPDAGTAWGAAVARDAGTVVVAVGPGFALPPFGEPARVDIWRIDADGSDAVNLTADSPANDALPHISADGRRVVFRSDRDGGRQVYVMDGDGRNVRRLSEAGGIETMPALSPDGEFVVFSTDRAGGMQLYVQHVNSSGGRFLEPDRLGLPEFNMHPRFSPDGQWVVFTSSRSGFNDEWPLTLFPQPYGELWAVPVAGGEAVRLTHDKWEDGPSDWGFVRLPPYEYAAGDGPDTRLPTAP
jgi:TolB protein